MTLLLASGSWDGVTCLWNVRDKSLLCEFRYPGSYVRSVALNGEGSLLASGGFDEKVRVWDTKTNTCLMVLQGFESKVRSLSWRQIEAELFLVIMSGKVVQYWQVFLDKKYAVLHWSSCQLVLNVSGANLAGAKLSKEDRELLKERGANDNEVVDEKQSQQEQQPQQPTPWVLNNIFSPRSAANSQPGSVNVPPEIKSDPTRQNSVVRR